MQLSKTDKKINWKPHEKFWNIKHNEVAEKGFQTLHLHKH